MKFLSATHKSSLKIKVADEEEAEFMRGGHLDNPLWTQARVLFEVHAPGGRSTRSIWLRRPFGLIGRIVGADIPIADTSVSARHAYLHIDDRGVCLIDLASRSGTRVNAEPITSSWLRIGDVIEIAGREIVLKEVHLNGFPFSPPVCHEGLLIDADDRVLVNISLEPKEYRGSSWVVGSELVFIGQGESCGIHLSGGSTAKTHCALLRASSCAYIIDLLVQRTRVNNLPVHGSARINDGDLLTIGQEHFVVHIEPFSGEHSPVPWGTEISHTPSFDEPSTTLAHVLGSLPTPSDGLPFPISTVPVDTQNSVFAWMLGAIQASHGELIRRQNDLQLAMTEVLRQVQDDSSIVLNTHLERIEALNRELAELKKVVAEQPSSPMTPYTRSNSLPIPSKPIPDLIATPVTSTEVTDAQPEATPLPSIQDQANGFIGPPQPVSERSRETTAWLLNKIDRIENEHKFSLKEIFRFGRQRSQPTSPYDDKLEADQDEHPPENPPEPEGPGSSS